MDTAESLYAFGQIWQGGNRVFPYFDRLQVDWDAAYREYIGRLLSEKEERQRILLLAEFGALLNDGHSGVSLPQTQGTVPLPCGMGC